ncbi:hypothetical protein [Ancylobacter pratisalsi]|uniref:Uncharacterized protein n=1 Tax=Ancylobacter pratisalsi TaxID=1745854 RepID=A0A6P1YJ86_9HYPH|nr:hypothetical protein [Ancylobacter pratisalsi]QIB33195.1 hypothetical protein G3A50_05360 [Ancylobacter pratisalsi]
MDIIDDDIAGFIEGEVMTVLAGRDAGMAATIGRGVGTARVGPDAFETLFSRAQWPQLAHDLHSGAPLAITFAAPSDYRCYQIKAVVLEAGPADAEGQHRAARYMADMAARLAGFGVPARPIAVWLCAHDLWRVRYRVREIFTQTPGANAGRKVSERGS